MKAEQLSAEEQDGKRTTRARKQTRWTSDKLTRAQRDRLEKDFEQDIRKHKRMENDRRRQQRRRDVPADNALDEMDYKHAPDDESTDDALDEMDYKHGPDDESAPSDPDRQAARTRSTRTRKHTPWSLNELTQAQRDKLEKDFEQDIRKQKRIESARRREQRRLRGRTPPQPPHTRPSHIRSEPDEEPADTTAPMEIDTLPTPSRSRCPPAPD